MSGSKQESERRATHDRLEIRTEARGDGAELRLSGELTLATLDAFRDRLRDTEPSASDVLVLDLRPLRFIDSLAIGELIAADKRSRGAGRRLVLVTTDGVVQRLLAMAGLDGRLEIRHEPPAVGEP
jgi:anti-anti-sigma factor